MKKYLLVVLALLLTLGVANATNIPVMFDPKETPIVWTELVYNGSASTIQSAMIVEWTFETSDVTEAEYDDRCNWVKTADGASDIWTAGVTPYGQTISAYTTGAIIIRGPAWIMEHSTPPDANNICGSHTDGTVTTDAASANTTSIGITIDASPTTGPMGTAGGYSLVFVDPTQEAD